MCKSATPQQKLAVASGQAFGVQGGSHGGGGSRSVRWADEEPATQTGFRIGASQQVCAGLFLHVFSTNNPHVPSLCEWPRHVSALICCTVLPPALQMQCCCGPKQTSQSGGRSKQVVWGSACMYAHTVVERLAVQASLRLLRSGYELAEVSLICSPGQQSAGMPSSHCYYYQPHIKALSLPEAAHKHVHVHTHVWAEKLTSSTQTMTACVTAVAACCQSCHKIYSIVREGLQALMYHSHKYGHRDSHSYRDLQAAKFKAVVHVVFFAKSW